MSRIIAGVLALGDQTLLGPQYVDPYLQIRYADEMTYEEWGVFAANYMTEEFGPVHSCCSCNRCRLWHAMHKTLHMLRGYLGSNYAILKVLQKSLKKELNELSRLRAIDAAISSLPMPIADEIIENFEQ